MQRSGSPVKATYRSARTPAARILWAVVLAVAVAGCGGAPERPAPDPRSAELPAGETPPDRAGKKLIKVPPRSMCECDVVSRQELVRDTTPAVAPFGKDSASDLVVQDAVNAMSAGERMAAIRDYDNYVRDFTEGRRALAGCIKDCECRGPFWVLSGIKRNRTKDASIHRALLLHPSDLLLAPDSVVLELPPNSLSRRDIGRLSLSRREIGRLSSLPDFFVVEHPDGNLVVRGEVYARGHKPGTLPELGPGC